MENEKSNLNDDLKGLPDADFLHDFGDELWAMLKSDGVKKDETTQNNFAETNHLSFSQCAAIAEKSEKPGVVEQNHLSGCKLCERRVAKLIELNQNAALKIRDEPQTKKKTFRQAISETFRAVSPRPIFAAAVFATFVILLSGVIVFIFAGRNQNNPQIAENPYRGENDSTNQNATNQNAVIANNAPVNDNSNVTKPSKSTEKTLEKPQTSPSVSSSNSQTKPVENSGESQTAQPKNDELAYLPPDERKAVIAGLRGDKIPTSNDLELLTRKETKRGAETENANEIKLQNPVNKAVKTSQPVFAWRNTENAKTYVVTIENQSRQEVAKSQSLSATSWKIDKNLESGFYFWRVSARNEKDTEINSNLGFFKVISGREKANIENFAKKSRSRIALATIYYRKGLFDEAKRELEIELKENPQSKSAKKLLKQIRTTQQNPSEN